MTNPPTRRFKAHSSQIKIKNHANGDSVLTVYCLTPGGKRVNLEIEVCEWGMKHALNEIADVFRKMKSVRERAIVCNRRAFEQEGL